MKHPHSILLMLLLASFIVTCKKKDDEEEPPPPQIVTNEFCDNECIFANDGECDDGGIKSTSDFCAYGTDCNDCGKRYTADVVD